MNISGTPHYVIHQPCGVRGNGRAKFSIEISLKNSRYVSVVFQLREGSQGKQLIWPTGPTK